MRPHRGELFETGNLEPPGFVVAEVEVEGVDFVRGQQVNQPEEVGLAGEVAGDVEHHAAVEQVGVVVDGYVVEPGRDVLPLQQREQGLRAVEDGVRRSPADGDVVVADIEPVVLVVAGLGVFGEVAEGDDGLPVVGDVVTYLFQFLHQQASFIGKTLLDAERDVLGDNRHPRARGHLFERGQHVVGLRRVVGLERFVLGIAGSPVGVRGSHPVGNGPLCFTGEGCDGEGYGYRLVVALHEEGRLGGKLGLGEDTPVEVVYGDGVAGGKRLPRVGRGHLVVSGVDHLDCHR